MDKECNREKIEELQYDKLNQVIKRIDEYSSHINYEDAKNLLSDFCCKNFNEKRDLIVSISDTNERDIIDLVVVELEKDAINRNSSIIKELSNVLAYDNCSTDDTLVVKIKNDSKIAYSYIGCKQDYLSREVARIIGHSYSLSEKISYYQLFLRSLENIHKPQKEICEIMKRHYLNHEDELVDADIVKKLYHVIKK